MQISTQCPCSWRSIREALQGGSRWGGVLSSGGREGVKYTTSEKCWPRIDETRTFNNEAILVHIRGWADCCNINQSTQLWVLCFELCMGMQSEFLLFLGYHVPQKDGRKAKQKQQKVPQYPKNSWPGMRNFGRCGIEDVCLKAKYTFNINKMSWYQNINLNLQNFVLSQITKIFLNWPEWPSVIIHHPIFPASKHVFSQKSPLHIGSPNASTEVVHSPGSQSPPHFDISNI